MRTMEEIYQEMAEEFQSRTGLTVGGSGELAVRFYTVAAQLYGLYAQAEWTRQQCFPQSAAGEMLDRHAQIRGISRHGAAKAGGTVRFFAGADRVAPAEIPAGTVCMTAAGERYVTTAAGVIPVGETQLDLPVEAVEAGGTGNAAAGQVIYLAVPPAGVTACSNPAAITGGQDEEKDEELRQRILDTYRRLANGANAAFYRQTAMDQEGVAAVTVLPRSRGVGTVDVVVAARGGMPDQALLDRLQSALDSKREIAVDVLVREPEQTAVNVTVGVTVKSGWQFAAVAEKVRAAVEGWFSGARLGCPVLQAELTALVFQTEGVANCTVTIAGGDVAADQVKLPCLGQLTVHES